MPLLWLLAVSGLSLPAIAAPRVVVDDSNRDLFEDIGGGVSCFSDPSQLLRVPGKVAKQISRSKKKSVSKEMFISRAKLNKDQITKFKKKKRPNKKKLKVYKAKLTQVLQRETSLCNAWSQVQIRWFPVDNATSYIIATESGNGTELTRETVEPSGCTHRLREGFTSGVCFFSFTTPNPAIAQTIRIRAINKSAESEPSEPILP